jgi:hypothetical protein
MKTEMTPEERLQQLESKCRRLSIALTSLMVAGATALLVAAAPKPAKDTLQTKGLEIVDTNGKVRIRLGSADAGYGLVVYDEQGSFKATLTDAPRGAVMQLRKEGGGIKLMAMEGGCGMTMRDENGKPRALIVYQEKGSEIMLKDKEGNTVFSAPK